MLNAVRVERHLQRLCRAKIIRPHHLAVGLTLLWNCRQPGGEAAQVSYDRLAALAGVCRRTAVDAVGLLCRLGVLAKEKTRLRVIWAFGTAIRQGRNIYCWLAIPECTPCATNQQQESKKEGHRGGAALLSVPKRRGEGALEAALASLGARLGAANRGNAMF
jgi:hypothetical protein